jgi:hypothetical protein
MSSSNALVISNRANSRIVDKQEGIGRATTSRGTRSITRSGDGLRNTLTILGILERWLLTDGKGGCQTVAGRIEKERFCAVFSTARVRRTITYSGSGMVGPFVPLGRTQNQ